MSLRGITEGPRSTHPSQTPPGRVGVGRSHAALSGTRSQGGALGSTGDYFDPGAVRRVRAPGFARAPSPAAASPRSHRWVDAMRRVWQHNEMTALQSAIVDNDVLQVRKLLQDGCDVEARDSLGHTPLHIAAALNSEKFIELLLEHGASIEANDCMGLTPLYCAAQFKAYGALALLIDEAKALTPSNAPWYSIEMLGATCAALRQRHVAAQWVDASTVDALLCRLVGVREQKVDQLNKLEPMLVYHAHLLSLTGEQFDLELEGWNEIDMLLQRVRTLLRTAALPPPLLPGFVPAAVGTALVHELRCDLEQIRLVHRLLVLEHLPACSPRTELLRQEARRLSWAVQHWPVGEEFCVPTGFPEHSCYVCFGRRVVDGENVITIRLDNLGSTQRAAQFTSGVGRVTPLTFNMPEPFLMSPQGAHALTQAMESLLESRVDGGDDDHALNAGVYRLLRHVKRYSNAALVERSPFLAASFSHKAQTVGNCVLKNHSAGMCARMGRALFKWFKRREVMDVEARLSSLIAPGVLRACEAQKWQKQWATLLDKDDLDVDDVHAFLDKPGRECVLWDMQDAAWRDILRRDDTKLLGALLKRGASLPDITPRKSAPLHWAIEANAINVAMALLRAGAPVDAIDEGGRTALHLAVRNSHTRLVDMLLTWGANPNIVDDDHETADAVVRLHAQQAKRMQRHFTRAAARRRAHASSDEPCATPTLNRTCSNAAASVSSPRRSESPAPG